MDDISLIRGGYQGRYLNADRTHRGPHRGPHSSILKRVRHLRTAGQGHIANVLAMIFLFIFCNEFSYSHGSVTLL